MASKKITEDKEELISSEVPKEIEYRIVNTSSQVVYIHLSSGSIAINPRENVDVPNSGLSEHIKILARRGHIGLFEKKEGV